VTDKVTKRFAVDRREGTIFVLVADSGETYDVPAAELAKPCRSEGAVLDVPMDAGKPQWNRARRNHGAEKGRLREAGDHIARLKRRDPGDDVSL
jgi:hypothetical protein